MRSDKRNTLKLKVGQPDIKSLKNPVTSKMNKLQRITFAGRYGRILDLLNVEVQTRALTALAQFYDPPLRCFTFRDFQLAPTLEEFEQILCFPSKNGEPYRHWGEHPKLDVIAKSLKIPIRDLMLVEETKCNMKGFSKNYLEQKVESFKEVGDVDAFMDMLALIIYGIVLFPNIENFVDFATIDVFLAFKTRGENLVPAILANVYYSIHSRHEKKGGVILCCLPVLYVWLRNQMYKKGCQASIKSDREWAHSLADLNEKTIIWYSREQEIQEVFYECGDFPNVPLIGTKGCINYNMALALRQLGYPMMGPPTEEMMTAPVLHDRGSRKVCRAWDKIIRKGRELGRRSIGAKESYRQWLRERVHRVKIPFRSLSPVVEETSSQLNIEDDEVERLKAALLKAEEEKKTLQGELVGARRAYEKIEANSQKTTSLENANKKAKIEEVRKLHFQNNLRASDELVTKRREERDKALNEVEKLKNLLTGSKIAERNAKRQLKDLEKQLENVVAEYKKRVEDEKQQMSMYHELWRKEQAVAISLRDRVEERQGMIREYEQESIYWMDRCYKLVSLANGAIEDIPEYLDRAETMINPLSTPKEITRFIEYCKNLVEQMGEYIRRNR